MKLINNYIFFILILISFNLFSDYIKLKSISKLKKGQSVEEVYELIDGESEKRILFDEDGVVDKFEIHSIIIDPDYFNTRYFLLFKNDSLLFWGFPHEFARHSNELYNDISAFAINILILGDEYEKKVQSMIYEPKEGQNEK